MEHFRDQEIKELENCEATVGFIKRTAKLIKAMNAKSKLEGLTTEPDNEANMVHNTYYTAMLSLECPPNPGDN